MYRFNLNGVECSCETAAELVAATLIDRIEGNSKSDKDVWVASQEWVGDAGDKLNKLFERKKGIRSVVKLSKGGNSSVPRSEMQEFQQIKEEQLNKCKHALTPSHCSVIENLPYVEHATWAATKKIAKKIGRTDILQLRTDLHARKKMGK